MANFTAYRYHRFSPLRMNLEAKSSEHDFGCRRSCDRAPVACFQKSGTCINDRRKQTGPSGTDSRCPAASFSGIHCGFGALLAAHASTAIAMQRRKLSWALSRFPPAFARPPKPLKSLRRWPSSERLPRLPSATAPPAFPASLWPANRRGKRRHAFTYLGFLTDFSMGSCAFAMPGILLHKSPSRRALLSGLRQ